ncbi:MAG TPA: hypothetical protein VLO07_06585, partial [Thermoanaerobaculia bacterium]|nr:hypothetical protein [Thermoanaerobaculia bacterium]
GLAAGLATHLYLASWVGAAALLALALWPPQAARSRRRRLLLPLVFAGMFACAAAPLFLFKEGRIAPYFARASDHSLLKEIGYWHSLWPAFQAAADSLAAPWFGVDPFRHQDLPGKTRLDWILGPPVALALARSLLRAREAFSAFLLCHGGAALAASIAGGHAGVPNSYRFGYLSNVTAVAAAGGMLCLLSLLSLPRRREGAFAVLALIALSGTLAARDALLTWPSRQETFDGFHGQDTLLARALLRWQPYGRVVFLPGLEHSGITIEGIFRYRLDPGQREGRDRAARTPSAAGAPDRSFRLVSPGTAPASGERLVERVDDSWGRSWGVVLARRAS